MESFFTTIGERVLRGTLGERPSCERDCRFQSLTDMSCSFHGKLKSNQTADHSGNEVVLERNEPLLIDRERKSDTNFGIARLRPMAFGKSRKRLFRQNQGRRLREAGDAVSETSPIKAGERGSQS